ncbi:hypothetical protein HMPREF9488_01991 [Coprobacillus cateniformis]|uniref:Uncharacterized protein n=1 Tax=Coprobacillus cateniformis TaxID=100884 RepID=E7GB51_9FIRM|nr:hypothetical protein HMPREF9488_01991 [Coprobacillus cateniformis]
MPPSTTEKETINLIKNTMIDAHFVLDNAKPCNGIWKVLLSWEISHALVVTILYAISCVIQNNLDSPNINTYFNIFRLLTIILYVIPIVTYIITLHKTNMTLKESSFLKILLYFPIIVFIIKILFPISYYLNTEALVALYDTFPVDIFFLVIFLIQFFLYFRKNTFILLIFISVFFSIFYTIIKLISFNSLEITSLIYLQINNILPLFFHNILLELESRFHIKYLVYYFP